MFIATVFDNGLVHIAGDNRIDKILLGITMIIHSVYDSEKISDGDKEILKEFVQTQLGRIAFKNEDEIYEEAEKIKKELKESKNNLAKLLREILKEVEE